MLWSNLGHQFSILLEWHRIGRVSELEKDLEPEQNGRPRIRREIEALMAHNNTL
jgi:hypothetical protein